MSRFHTVVSEHVPPARLDAQRVVPNSEQSVGVLDFDSTMTCPRQMTCIEVCAQLQGGSPSCETCRKYSRQLVLRGMQSG